MTKMKKWLSVLLAAAMVCGSTAVVSADEIADTPEPAAQEEELNEIQTLPALTFRWDDGTKVVVPSDEMSYVYQWMNPTTLRKRTASGSYVNVEKRYIPMQYIIDQMTDINIDDFCYGNLTGTEIDPLMPMTGVGNETGWGITDWHLYLYYENGQYQVAVSDGNEKYWKPVANEIALYHHNNYQAMGGYGDIYWICQDCYHRATNSTPYVRAAGPDRYLTSINVAEKIREYANVEQFETIVLASGKNFPDALSAANLVAETTSYGEACPVLLIDPDNPDETISYLKAVYNDVPYAGIAIMGGTSAIPASIENRLKAEFTESYIGRFAGSDRYATNLEALDAVLSSYDYIDTLMVCSGQNFPDAVCASAYGYPIMLVGDALTKEQKSWLDSKEINNVIILGLNAAVKAEVEKQIKGYCNECVRIGGADRYETALELMKYMDNGFSFLAVARGDSFPDALAAGPLAQVFGGPVALIDDAHYPALLKYCNDNYYHSGIVVGGPAAVSDEAAEGLF
ncbi:MAG: cell wall-binding repeat-containing protein, partial [Lachnospiraceae bacterium]|nr:cell wall-binding repeat-containing protein [Candidatus Equihabitans merdae]